MRKFDEFLLKVFLFELPVLMFYFIFLFIFDLQKAAQTNVYAKVWYDFGGCAVFGSWMLISLYLSVRLMLSAEFREKILSKITFLKERDEREFILTGQAAKTTMLTTLAVLIFLFCLSCFQVSVYRVPPEQAIDGKDKVLSLGFQLDLSNSPQSHSSQSDANTEDIVSYTALPISSSSVILGLIGWQILSYNYLMHRAMK
ncbi:hypothetical protein [Sporomusa acidovorans]|uniref:Uncharacterized protein n=1 Tax=Sporomusa acidovorans (strain ATCC 49682 / DSM 3132 / Mol) TaxID=1123286 RepID=A0ABZ3IZG6_SPOA4|nr:hypothetical protein [Sporomusa acidovorans]OZC18342.1 hypothetical protein SPACI_35040 [Sporomusa acidovorans DSM 3132]SDF19498.1 hypothetical protein SAMN04488499_10375 [Sporomusa acidovorans]